MGDGARNGRNSVNRAGALSGAGVRSPMGRPMMPRWRGSQANVCSLSSWHEDGL